jgi:nicotinate dehydrogenase subunit B
MSRPMTKTSKGMQIPATLTRRTLLASGGAVVVGFSITDAFAQAPPTPAAPGAAPAAPPLPGSLRAAPSIDSWIRIDASGKVTVFTGKIELGQGIKTALVQVAAEQLAVPLSSITLVTADTARTPGEGYTAGSQSMQDSGTAIMHASAQAREILVRIAAEKLGADAATLKAADGFVVASDGRKLGYGDLVAGDVLKVQAGPAATSKLIAPAAYKVMGKSLPRVDLPAKVTGGAAFVHDLRLDGMLHARVIRPPSYGAKLEDIEETEAAKMPGVRRVIRDGNFLAVVAVKEFQAVKAMEKLAAAARWSETATLPAAADFFKWLPTQDKRSFTIRDVKGTATPARTFEAEYHRPYHMHGSIGPACGVAQFKDGEMTVWACSQGMFPLREAIAELTKLPMPKVRCIHLEGSGCYGHNAADDAAADAAYIALKLEGPPVRVQWMRADEHTWEPYGAGMVMRVKAGLDAQGMLTNWEYDVFTDTHSTRPGGAGSTLAGQAIADAFKMPPPQPIPQPNGSGDRNIIPPYTTPSLKLVHNYQAHMKLRVSALRGLGAYANVFAIENFMDELAAAAGADPVAFRLKHLTDPRAIDCVKLAADKFGWKAGAVTGSGNGRGQGFAYSRYKGSAGYCAIGIEVEVDQETGRVRLLRAVAAADSGTAVNPDGIKNQIEGGIIQSASWTLHEAVNFDRTRILSRDWSRYPILRFPETFQTLEVHLIDRPGTPFLGTGEVSQGPTGAAIANAIFHATGKRIRELPYTPANVKAAIGV